MLRTAAIIGALILWGSCNRSEGGDAPGGPLTSALPVPAKPSAGGGFSAALAKDLGVSSPAVKPSSASDAPVGPTTVVAATPKAGSGSGGSAAVPGAAVGSAAAAPKSGSARASAGSGSPGPSTSPVPEAAAASPGSAPPPVEPVARGSAHGPVRVPAELAAIKLSLLPNWDRDLDAAGTFQYVVRIKGTQSTKTFSFRYGYDDPKAPSDRDLYKKYLQDAKVMVGEIRDRQRGSAWFLEGTDAFGLPVFRYVVLYGGKRLICYGSLYKDAASSRLGDDRDQTVIQAKQICETLAL